MNELIMILQQAMIGVTFDMPRPSEDAKCHAGLFKMESCGRCSRAKKLYDAIEAAEAWLVNERKGKNEIKSRK